MKSCWHSHSRLRIVIHIRFYSFNAITFLHDSREQQSGKYQLLQEMEERKKKNNFESKVKRSTNKIDWKKDCFVLVAQMTTIDRRVEKKSFVSMQCVLKYINCCSHLLQHAYHQLRQTALKQLFLLLDWFHRLEFYCDFFCSQVFRRYQQKQQQL